MLLDLVSFDLVLVEDLLLIRRCAHIVDRNRHTRTHGVQETNVLEAIEAGGNFALDELTSQCVDDDAHKALVDRFIDELEAVRQHRVEEHTTRSGRGVRGRNAVGWGCHQARGAELDGVVQSDVAVFVGTLEVKQIAVDLQFVGHIATGMIGQVVGTDDHVLRWRDERTTMGGAQHVVGRQHQDASLGLRLGRQWQVNSHLVAVEVGVERGAYQRVNLDGFTFDQDWLERLDTKTVQRRCTVQHDRVFLDDLGEDIPHFALATFNHAFG